MRLKRSGYRFILVGTIALGLSLLVFLVVLRLSQDATLATFLRITGKVPILYFGYSRFVLRETWLKDLSEMGKWRAEYAMIKRVTLAMGVSELAKLAIEPPLTTYLITQFGHSFALLGPLCGDLLYGPVLSFSCLYLSGRDGHRG